jgi:O-methyltransferase
MLAHFAASSVPGDFVETGVAAGGTSVLMLRVMLEHNDSAEAKARTHWSCDSFMGLPAGVEADHNCTRKTRELDGAASCGYRGKSHQLSSFRGMFRHGEHEFRRNVRDAGFGRLLHPEPSRPRGPRLRVVPGWFNRTLPPAGLDRISFLRLDGDLYESTRDGLRALYPLVAPGGAIYVDDYGGFGGCRQAVDDYRVLHGVRAKLHRIWEVYQPRRSPGGAAHDYVGRAYEAAWWIKDG